MVSYWDRQKYQETTMHLEWNVLKDLSSPISSSTNSYSSTEKLTSKETCDILLTTYIYILSIISRIKFLDTIEKGYERKKNRNFPARVRSSPPLLADSFFDTLREPARIDSVPPSSDSDILFQSAWRDYLPAFALPFALPSSLWKTVEWYKGIRWKGTSAAERPLSVHLLLWSLSRRGGRREEDVRRFKVEAWRRSQPPSLNSNNARYE